MESKKDNNYFYFILKIRLIFIRSKNFYHTNSLDFIVIVKIHAQLH